MVYRGQRFKKFFITTKATFWLDSVRKQRQRLRQPRRDYHGVVHSLYIKQYRGNVWGDLRFKESFMRKLGHYKQFFKENQRNLGEFSRGEDAHYDFLQNSSAGMLKKIHRRRMYRYKYDEYEIDLTDYKQFYRVFNKTVSSRHTRNLLYHRYNSFQGNLRQHALRRIFREGSIKGNTFSGNLFVFRFVSRLSHFLYFCGFANTLALATRLIQGKFVFVDDKLIVDPLFKIPLFSRVYLELSPFMYNLISPSIISYNNISATPSLEINFKLLSARFFKLCSSSEIIFQGSLFDHMFMYEQFAPIIK